MNTLSYSRINLYEQCPYRYALRYVYDLENVEPPEANNALILGSALFHKGIETQSVDEALKYYRSMFPVFTDRHVDEEIKLEHWIPIISDSFKKHLDNLEFEVEIKIGNFVGYIDCVEHIDNETVNLIDFKYSSNPNRYLESGQLSIYKYYFEKQTGLHVNETYYLVIPKTNIRQKKNETLEDFRQRLIETLKTKEVVMIQEEYNLKHVVNLLTNYVKLLNTNEYEPNESNLCHWCEYEKFCKEGDNSMILPKAGRRPINYALKKKIFVYGAPFSGKTVFADGFPNPLMLNTDGNIGNVTAPFVPIKDEVTAEGRITKRKYGWEVLKETILELEKGGNDFETIVLDLVEDSYESCRQYMYNQLGLDHESDDPFRAWDKVRTEFFTVIKRFMNLDYKNLILISHEDTSSDITKKGGDKITAIKPNLQPKIANKLAGMVDIVVRAVAEGNNYMLTFKRSEVVFGGGRLNTSIDEIPNSYEAICKVYEDANRKAMKEHEEPAPESTPEEIPVDVQEVTENVEERPKRKRRKKSEDAEEELEINRDELPF